MDFFDAFRETMKSGQKVRSTKWYRGGYFYWDGKTLIEDSQDKVRLDALLSWINDDDKEWEFYNEAVTFDTLQPGDKFWITNKKDISMKTHVFRSQNCIDSNGEQWACDNFTKVYKVN